MCPASSPVLKHSNNSIKKSKFSRSTREFSKSCKLRHRPWSAKYVQQLQRSTWPLCQTEQTFTWAGKPHFCMIVVTSSTCKLGFDMWNLKFHEVGDNYEDWQTTGLPHLSMKSGQAFEASWNSQRLLMARGFTLHASIKGCYFVASIWLSYHSSSLQHIVTFPSPSDFETILQLSYVFFQGNLFGSCCTAEIERIDPFFLKDRDKIKTPPSRAEVS